MDWTWIGAIVLGLVCLTLSCYFASGHFSHTHSYRTAKNNIFIDGVGVKSNPKKSLQVEKMADILEDFKVVLVVRNDLKMGKGKIAAQCCHAMLGLYKKLLDRAPKSLSRWERCGQVKVVVKTESEEELLILQGKAKSIHLPTHITIDAGKTQIAPNSRTVMALLGPSTLVDEVTGGLKLL